MTDINDLARAMRSPETFSHETGHIEVVQTQMSVVFLTGQFAYKVKKPVKFGYLDYSTIEKRLEFCKKELELNKRLCPDTYLKVVTVRQLSGKIRLGESGQVIDYAVKMRQLPRERMMDELLKSDEVTAAMVREVAVRLADFHRSADTGTYVNSFGETCSIMVNIDENFDQTGQYVGRSITDEQFRKIRDYSNAFLRSHAALMHERIDQGRIRDCHGDLRAAHVCFTKTAICIYDCIEFNDRFRYSDVASEIAFLAMDLDRYSRQDLSSELVDAYVKSSGDQTLRAMLPFYKCYRAYVRGKVESFKLDDAYLTEADKARALENAQQYFALACAYASKAPSLIIMLGLVGTGKTTTARSLAATIDAVVLSSDVVRKQIAGIPPDEHHYEEFQSGLYTADATRRTYDKLFDEARITLVNGRSVIIDASFQKMADRVRAKHLAAEISSRFTAVECVLPEAEAKRRLDRRMNQVSASDATWQTYVRQKESFEPASELAESEHILVDTSANWDQALKRIIERTEL